MTEWGVFGVISALITLALAIGAPVLKLNKSINILTVTVEHLKELLAEMKRENAIAHDDLQEQIDEHSKQLVSHTRDIAILKDRELNGK